MRSVSWEAPAPASRMAWLPRFEVRMMMQFLKLTVRPWESVTRPSSSTCPGGGRGWVWGEVFRVWGRGT